MMAGLQNAIRLQALRAMSDLATSRVGLITSFDPGAWAVRVALQPDGFLSGWLPLASPWIGNGWGMLAAPNVGDMVAVHFFGGDLEAGFVESRFFNDVDRPLPVQAGEFWLVHASGATIKLGGDGAVQLIAAVVKTSETLIAGNGASGTFTTPTGQTVTVQDGIVTNIY